jgi:hypothetical protein
MLNLERLLIYKGNGGLAHNLFSLSHAIEICEIQKRDLIIDMNKNSAFKIKFSDIFIIKDVNIKYYDSYDNIDLNIVYKKLNNQTTTINDIKQNTLSIKNKKYHLLDENIQTIEKNIMDNIVVFAGYVPYTKRTFNIQINENIINKLSKEELIKEPYISIHFRNTDIKNDIQMFIEKIHKILYTTKINIIYISSDYYKTYDIISKEFPQLLVIRKTIPDNNIYNLHYSNKNKYDEIYECIRDIYYISKSNFFIPSYNSGLSKLMINQIQQNNPIIPNITSTTQII